MAIDKNSNGYTFMFAIIMVVVVGASLAAVSFGLKPLQTKNQEVKKKMDILGALNIETTRQNAEADYDKYILTNECVVLDAEGNLTDGVAFDIDIKKDFKDKNLKVEDRKYPLFVGNVDGKKKYIIPMVGSGLWGPIWGFISIDEDKASIYGAKFDHKGETPGLGAEIKQPLFFKQFESEVISTAGIYQKIKVVKDGSGSANQGAVDGITGGTITSKGVEEMLDRTLQVYVKYFQKI